MLLAIDPGKEKCGMAVVEESRKILERGIVSTQAMESHLTQWISKWNPGLVLLGNGTYSEPVRKIVKPLLNHIPLVIVNEYNSTYLARKLYFQHNPPRGIWRFIPLGLQVPPVPYDDYAAVFLAFRYLSESKKTG